MFARSGRDWFACKYALAFEDRFAPFVRFFQRTKLTKRVGIGARAWFILQALGGVLRGCVDISSE